MELTSHFNARLTRSSIVSSVFTEKENTFLTANRDGTVTKVTYQPKFRQFSTRITRSEVTAMAYEIDNFNITRNSNFSNRKCLNRMILGTSTGDILIVSNDFKIIATLHQKHFDRITKIQFFDFNKYFLTASYDGSLKIFNAQGHSYEFICSFYDHQGYINDFSFAPNEKTFITACADKKLRLFDVRKRRCIAIIGPFPYVPTTVLFHPEGKHYFVGFTNGVVACYKLKGARKVMSAQVHQGSISSIAFHNSRSFLASVSVDSTISILEVESGTILFSMFVKQKGLNNVIFSDDGWQLMTTSVTGRLTIWDFPFNTLILKSSSVSSAENENEIININGNDLDSNGFPEVSPIPNNSHTMPIRYPESFSAQGVQQPTIAINSPNMNQFSFSQKPPNAVYIPDMKNKKKRKISNNSNDSVEINSYEFSDSNSFASVEATKVSYSNVEHGEEEISKPESEVVHSELEIEEEESENEDNNRNLLASSNSLSNQINQDEEEEKMSSRHSSSKGKFASSHSKEEEEEKISSKHASEEEDRVVSYHASEEEETITSKFASEEEERISISTGKTNEEEEERHSSHSKVDTLNEEEEAITNARTNKEEEERNSSHSKADSFEEEEEDVVNQKLQSQPQLSSSVKPEQQASQQAANELQIEEEEEETSERIQYIASSNSNKNNSNNSKNTNTSNSNSNSHSNSNSNSHSNSNSNTNSNINKNEEEEQEEVSPNTIKSSSSSANDTFEGSISANASGNLNLNNSAADTFNEIAIEFKPCNTDDYFSESAHDLQHSIPTSINSNNKEEENFVQLNSTEVLSATESQTNSNNHKQEQIEDFNASLTGHSYSINGDSPVYDFNNYSDNAINDHKEEEDQKSGISTKKNDSLFEEEEENKGGNLSFHSKDDTSTFYNKFAASQPLLNEKATISNQQFYSDSIQFTVRLNSSLNISNNVNNLSKEVLTYSNSSSNYDDSEVQTDSNNITYSQFPEVNPKPVTIQQDDQNNGDDHDDK